VRLAGAMFGIAIKVAAPAVVALLVAGIAMAFAARTAPQVETLAAGVPVRVLVGFTVLALGAAGFAAAVAKAVGR
jgi:flagellar biosynthetic protein FliR